MCAKAYFVRNNNTTTYRFGFIEGNKSRSIIKTSRSNSAERGTTTIGGGWQTCPTPNSKTGRVARPVVKKSKHNGTRSAQWARTARPCVLPMEIIS